MLIKFISKTNSDLYLRTERIVNIIEDKQNNIWIINTDDKWDYEIPINDFNKEVMNSLIAMENFK